MRESAIQNIRNMQEAYDNRTPEEPNYVAEIFRNDYVNEKAEALINGDFSKEYDEFLGEITFLDEVLSHEFFKLEKKLITSNGLNTISIKDEMRKTLKELAVLFYEQKLRTAKSVENLGDYRW